MQQGKVPISWMFVLGILAFLVIAILVSSPPGQETKEEQASLEHSPHYATYQAMLEKGSEAILVEDHKAGEETVVVVSAEFSEPGFIVIYKDDDGMPGSVIGVSSYLLEGEQQLFVSLDEPLEANKVYYAILKKDDGDGEYHNVKDRAFQNNNNEMIVMTFKTLEIDPVVR